MPTVNHLYALCRTVIVNENCMPDAEEDPSGAVRLLPPIIHEFHNGAIDVRGLKAGRVEGIHVLS